MRKRNMKRILGMFFLITVLLITGCDSKITIPRSEEEMQKMISESDLDWTAKKAGEDMKTRLGGEVFSLSKEDKEIGSILIGEENDIRLVSLLLMGEPLDEEHPAAGDRMAVSKQDWDDVIKLLATLYGEKKYADLMYEDAMAYYEEHKNDGDNSFVFEKKYQDTYCYILFKEKKKTTHKRYNKNHELILEEEKWVEFDGSANIVIANEKGLEYIVSELEKYRE